MTTETAETTKTAYEKACAKLNMQPATIESFAHEAEEDRKMAFGEHKFRTCVKAANLDADGKPYNPDWKNWDEWKWRMWFVANKTDKRPSGVGFSFDVASRDAATTDVGSRLYSRSEKIADDLGNDPEIVEYFNEWMGV